MKKVQLLFFYQLVFYFSINAQDVFWAEHIAPIIYDNCSSCHHDGGIAPFSLMSYQDAIAYSDQIHHVTDERSMPPWPADPAYRHFVGEAYLDQAEIDLIHEWILDGLAYGDESFEPAPPVFPPQGSLLENIDFTVAIEPYTLQSDFDEYRWFVIENPFDEPVYISKLEVISGLEQVVHHVDLFYDLSGNSLAYDQSDPLPGFNSNTGWPTNDYYINAWAPGGNIAVYPNNWGIMIPPEAAFVVEVHYGPGGIGLIDSTKMNIQFVTNPNNVRPVETRWLLTDTAPVLLDGPLVIPANEVVTFHQQSAPLSTDMSLVTICPHMHWLGKSYRVWFESPQGDSIPLIDIPHWDFHWQKYYTFQQIQKIPAGSILKSEGVYDNTLNNHDNPNNPPITVSRGLTTEDEMFLCYFIYSDYQEGDEDIIMDSTLITTNVLTPISTKKSWSVFPNPATDQIYLTGTISSNSKVFFRIVNSLGEVLYQQHRENHGTHWDENFSVKDFSPGIYYLEWWDGRTVETVGFTKL